MNTQTMWSNFFTVIRNWFLKLFQGKKNPFLVLIHPIDTIDDIKYKKNGSFVYATLLLIAYSVSAIIKEVATGFIYSTLRIKDFNVLIVLCTSGLMILLFVLANWCLCTLLSGEGRVIDIYIMICYNLLPLIFYNIVSTVMSQILVEDEFTFVSIFGVCMEIWFVALMIYGAKTVHNFSFWGTVLNLILSLVAMAIIFFLLFLFVTLVQQIYIFVLTIYTECRMRAFS